MSQIIRAAGLRFELEFCKKINEKPIEEWEVSVVPLANIHKSEDLETYIVNILAYIPADFSTVNECSQSCIDLLPKEKNKLFFNYNGVSAVKTSIHSASENDTILCRSFSIDYNSSKDEPIKYNLYHIKLNYRIVTNNGQSVEAIIVHDRNFDPVTSRGTVTTVRDHND